jgi:hypothetical protein
MNIKITKSSYKTKENKRAIIYDCSAKNYRKKINTGILVEEEYFENSESTTSISLNITLEKLKSKKKDALIKFYENDWSTSELENFLKKGIDIYSVEEYVKTNFVKNKSPITANDYLNVVKVFKKHLKKENIHFNDLLEENTIFEFKYNAEKKDLKRSSINSYIKKMAVIMNMAYKESLINKRFVIPKLVIEKRQKSITSKSFNKEKFIEAVNKSEDLYQIQSLSIFLMLIVCGGMTPSNLVNYKVIENKKQKDLVSSILYDENSIILKYRKSNKGEAKKHIKLCHIKIKIIELVKTLFYITHQKKYPFIISPYSNYYSIFDFDIHKDQNLYRNFWNFYQMKIKENYDLRFSDAKNIYIQKLSEIEMNRTVSDILFSRVNEAEIISFQQTKNVQESIEKYEKEILNSFAASELIQVIKNKLIFLGVDLTKTSLNNIKTPLAFSDFIQTINKYRIGLKNSGFL